MHFIGGVQTSFSKNEFGAICKKEFRVSHMKYISNTFRRRLNRPLIFGDIIEYNIEEHLDKRGFIRSFERLAPYLKSRMKDGEGQVSGVLIYGLHHSSRYFWKALLIQ